MKLWAIPLALLIAPAGYSQTLSGEALVKALRQGGYVIVMRHTSSPREVPSKPAANPGNTKPERQLDEEGRAAAKAMGEALRKLKVPVGEVLVSPAYRAMETAKYAQFPNPRPTPELGENGRNMSGGTEAQAAWLRKKITELPKGTNTILITHAPNLTRAFQQQASGLADGEAMIFGPSGLVARVKVGEWPKLAH